MFDLDEDRIDILFKMGVRDFEVVEGSNADYIDLIGFFENNDLSVPANYEYVQTQMDVDNFVDYYITEIYFNNKDWPGSNNIKFWKPQKPEGRWRWLLYDSDAGWGSRGGIEYNMLHNATVYSTTNYPNPAWSTLMIRKLLENPDFELKFLNRFACLMKEYFIPDLLNSRVDEFKNLYNMGMEEHIERWNHPSSLSDWDNNVNEALSGFAMQREIYVIQHIMTKFNLSSFNLDDYNCDNIQSVSNISLNQSVEIYPNPANDYIQINFQPDININEITIYDMSGKKKLFSKIEPDKKVFIGQLTSGLYLVQLRIGDTIIFEKIIKH